MTVTRELPSCTGRSEFCCQGRRCIRRPGWTTNHRNDCERPASARTLITTCSNCEAVPVRVAPPFGPTVSAATQEKEQKHKALRVCQKQPASKSVDRKNSSLTATASTGSCVQQDALPYRVEVRLSHSATLCNPLQPDPPVDDNLLHRLAYRNCYCVRTDSPCQRVRRRAPQMSRTVVSVWSLVVVIRLTPPSTFTRHRGPAGFVPLHAGGRAIPKLGDWCLGVRTALTKVKARFSQAQLNGPRGQVAPCTHVHVDLASRSKDS